MDALRFDHKHYVPILKTKAGEIWTLTHLKNTTRQFVTPLLEVHPHKTRAPADHAQKVCPKLFAGWGSDALFLDTRYLHGDAGGASVIRDVFKAARKAALHAIPVVRLTYDAAMLKAFKDILEENDVEVLLRIGRPDTSSAAALAAVLAAIGRRATSAHLLVDYQSDDMELAVDVPKVPHLSQWRTFTAAAGKFPKSLITLAPGTWHSIPRTDWNSWLAPVVAGLTRAPTFGDYAVRAPGAPSNFGDPVVNVRYTTDPDWLVRTGGKHKAGAAPQIKGICQSLLARPEYSGAPFSAGDQAFSDVASGTATYGGPTQWVQWSVSHHVEFVSEQIQTNPSL